jgi:uncharacterized Rmd1/YagE family protein
MQPALPDSRLILTIKAFQIAEALDVKRCRAEFPGVKLTAAAPQELFYRRRSEDSGVERPSDGYLYLMDYGVVIFAGYEEPEMRRLIERLRPYTQGPLDAAAGSAGVSEDLRVHADSSEAVFGFNDIHLPSFNEDVLRIIMLYVGQSAALDHYEAAVDGMLKESAGFSRELARHGRLKTSRRNVQRFIGRTLAIRNRIVDNLYIMDAPDITWENEYLDKIDRGMKKTFDIVERFRSIDLQLREIKESLELYAELLQFRHSNMLEWIIIALFLIEVINLFRH